jgi:hypothetical protein
MVDKQTSFYSGGTKGWTSISLNLFSCQYPKPNDDTLDEILTSPIYLSLVLPRPAEAS